MNSPLRRFSFQAKLIVGVILIVVLTSVAGYLFINHSVRSAFDEFTVGSNNPQDRMVRLVLQGLYDETGDIDQLIAALEQSGGGMPYILADEDGTIVQSPDARYLGRRLSDTEMRQGQALVLADGSVWTLVSSRAVFGRDALEQGFLNMMGRSLWLAGLAAAAIAILLSIFLVRQITHPLRRLSAATQRVAKGEFDQPVEIDTADEIGRLAGSFNDMASSLAASERTKRQMIADISHELRTPLTAVRTALEGLRDGVIETTPETLASLHDKILLTTRLVQDLHQLSLADAGRLSLHKLPHRFDRIVDTIVETIGVQLEDASIRLERRIGELPLVDVDVQRIEQVLLNLLANAIRHTPDGGTIRIEAISVGGEIQASVCDSGSGLRPSDIDHVFDRFYRADEARSGDDGGAGLGLSIAKALIEAHGGRIWAENAVDGGACFRFRLPTAA